MSDTARHLSKLLQRAEPADDAILRLLDKPLSEDDLREATRRVAQPLDLAEKDVAALLVFQLGGELMAFPSAEVKQVAAATRVHRIPHRSNKTIRGLTNLDSELLLSADLAQLLELTEDAAAPSGKQTNQRRMIVLGELARRWVVEVDAVRGIASVPRSALRQPPLTADASLAHYTSALATLGDELVAVLDVDRVITGFQAALR